MQLIKAVLSTVALFGSAAVGLNPEVEVEDGVYVLGDDSLADMIKATPFLLVEFYAPWCGHCKQLAPEYAAAAQELEDNEDIKLAKVDATEETNVASEYGVSGYPTLKFFKNGEVSDYNGGRTSKDIVDWITKKTGPSVHYPTDADEITKMKDEHQLVCVLYTTDASEDNKVVKSFTQVADASDDVKFVILSDSKIAAALEIEGDNSIVLFKQYDEGRVEFDGEKMTKSKIESFLTPHLLPYVVEFSDEIVQRLFGGSIKEHMIYFRKDSGSDADKEVLDQYREVAKAHQGELIFVAVDMGVESNSRLSEFFGLSEEDYPAVRVINIEAQPIKFRAPEGFELTKEGFELFASKYIAGELSPALNSEAVPEDWDAEDLKVVVGANFKEVVLDESVNVLVMAHAPWCGHCKSLMPVFEELATKFAEDDTVVIAKMDATKNEVTEFNIQGFPTLKFFPSGKDAEDLEYDGERDLDSLVAYVNENRGDAEVVEIEEKDEL